MAINYGADYVFLRQRVAITASAHKSFRYRIYIGAKATSLAVMRFRNLYRNAQGQIGLC